MKVRPGRMVHLGYAKYWRSDEIVGLLPIEEDRGPGRRTAVYVAGREEPIVASRAEDTILEEMADPSAGEGADPGELREALEDMKRSLEELSPVIRRVLRNEEGFDAGAWIKRLADLAPPDEEAGDQEELFPEG